MEYLRSIPADDKVLVYSEWTSLFPVIQSVLTYEGIESVIVDGNLFQNNNNFIKIGKLSLDKRSKNIDTLEKDKNVKVMLLSLKVGMYTLLWD